MLLPAVAAALVLAGVARGDFTNWDDPRYLLSYELTSDPLAHGIGGLLLTPELGYPIPVTVLGYAAQRAAFGLDPAAFHIVSLVLHILCALLAAILARRLRAPVVACAAAGALFAIHPLVVEPVAWVVGQKDLLAAMFLLAALYVRACPRGASISGSVATALLLTLSLAAKPNTVAAPLLVAGLDLIEGRQIASRQNLLLYVYAIALAGTAVALSLIGHGGEPVTRLSVHSLGEAAWGFGLEVRHVFWPHPLRARYFPPEGASLTAGIVLGLALLGIAIEAVVYAYRSGKREVAYSIAAALLAYAPVSGLLPLTRGPSDSYMYLPLALSVIAIARGLGWLGARTILVWVAVAAAAAGLAATSRALTETWRDSVALWSRVAEHHPDDPRALMRVGDALLFDRKPEAALAVYDEIRRRFPDFPTSTIAHAQTLGALGRLAEAERMFALGVTLSPEPVYRENYGMFLLANTTVEPSNPDAARKGLLAVAPVLAEQGKGEKSLTRAAVLLERYGETATAAMLRERLAKVRRERAAPSP
jgi:hypothetical protein